MHELGIMTGVMESVEEAARNAGATKVLEIDLSVGVMTEAVEDALRFAFEALSEGTMCEGADFKINMIQPVSVCLECGNEFETRPLPRNVPPVRKWIHTAYCLAKKCRSTQSRLIYPMKMIPSRRRSFNQTSTSKLAPVRCFTRQ